MVARSSTLTGIPRAATASATRSASVVLPLPGRPVIQMAHPAERSTTARRSCPSSRASATTRAEASASLSFEVSITSSERSPGS